MRNSPPQMRRGRRHCGGGGIQGDGIQRVAFGRERQGAPIIVAASLPRHMAASSRLHAESVGMNSVASMSN